MNAIRILSLKHEYSCYGLFLTQYKKIYNLSNNLFLGEIIQNIKKNVFVNEEPNGNTSPMKSVLSFFPKKGTIC